MKFARRHALTEARIYRRAVSIISLDASQYVTRRLCIKKMPERVAHESNRVLVSSPSPSTYLYNKQRSVCFAVPNLSSPRKLEKVSFAMHLASSSFLFPRSTLLEWHTEAVFERSGAKMFEARHFQRKFLSKQFRNFTLKLQLRIS